MPGQRCTVCGNTQASDPTASFHRIPKETVIRATWMSLFDLKEEDIKPSTWVCCRHFPNGDAKKMPDMTLGKTRGPQQAINLVRDCINLCKILNLEVHWLRKCIVKLCIFMYTFLILRSPLKYRKTRVLKPL